MTHSLLKDRVCGSCIKHLFGSLYPTCTQRWMRSAGSAGLTTRVCLARVCAQMLRHQIMKLPTKEDTRKQLDSVEDEIKKIQQDITSHQHTFQVGGCRGLGAGQGCWRPRPQRMR